MKKFQAVFNVPLLVLSRDASNLVTGFFILSIDKMVRVSVFQELPIYLAGRQTTMRHLTLLEYLGLFLRLIGQETKRAMR